MALPPDNSESFVREVEENLRRDQAEAYLKKNGPWIVTAALVFLAAVAGWIYWQNQQLKASQAGSEELVAGINMAGDNREGAMAKFDELAKNAPEGIAVQAKLAKAVSLVESGDRTGAIQIYREIAADSGLEQPYRDLAVVRQTALEFDQLKPDQVVQRLAPLAKPDSAWFGSAGEMTAMALLKQNKDAEAGRLFAQIAADKNVPVTIRSRAVQIAGTLGVDATAAIADISGGTISQ